MQPHKQEARRVQDGASMHFAKGLAGDVVDDSVGMVDLCSVVQLCKAAERFLPLLQCCRLLSSRS